MANVQLQKTRNAATFTKTAIDQKQSLEVVQTLLHGGLSTLAYLRNFFGDKAYERQIYDMSETIHSYQDYAAGKLSKKTTNAVNPFTEVVILKRNRSKRVDTCLDWLENGVFTALKDSTLRALQIYVHPDFKDREKVIESYTFTIKYLLGSEGNRILAGLEMDTPGNALVSVGATNKALQDLIRQIMKRCAQLPDLPDQRFVTMEIFYTEETVKPVPSSGWVPSTSEKLLFAQSEGWEKRTERLEDLKSGFHSTSLKISHLQPISQADTERYFGYKPAFPKSLQYNKSFSKQEDLDAPKDESRISQVGEDSDGETTAPVNNSATPSTVVENDAPQKSTDPLPECQDGKRALTTPTATSDLPDEQIQRGRAVRGQGRAVSRATTVPDGRPLFDDSIKTQSSNIPSMTKNLTNMMQQEFLTQGDTQTQGVPYQHPSREENARSRERSASRNSGSTNPFDLKQTTKPVLSKRTIIRLDGTKATLRSAARRVAKAEGANPKFGELVLCHCHHQEDEGHMACCVYCETWQHLHCYGFTGDSDPRLPENHVCYQCLLGEREEETLKKLADLVQKRRAMHFAFENGLRSKRHLAKDMGVKPLTGAELYKYLQQEGYVVAAEAAHRAGSAASNKPVLVAVKDGPDHKKMLMNLFDPMTHISHHFASPSETALSTSLSRQLLAALGEKMLPPATPASQSKKYTQTPSTGLDLPASTTPFETPSRPGSHQILAKRRRDGSEDVESPRKRQATPTTATQRLESVRTPYMVDVGGISPAPTSINGSDCPFPKLDSVERASDS